MALPVLAANLSTPTGRVLLTVSGAIDVHNGNGVAAFDRAMLETLDWQEIETYTSFTAGKQTFSGPTLASLFEAVRAQGGVIKATAINDYSVEFPLAYADNHDVILALEHNGKRMRVRDRGPIWIIFPLSEAKAAQQPFDREMIWQLDRIVIR